MSGKKLIDAAQEALRVAECNHIYEPIRPDAKNPKKFERFACCKCHAVLYLPIEDDESQKDAANVR
jgi:hypothetical protein